MLCHSKKGEQGRRKSRYQPLARRSRYQPLARFSSVLREAFDKTPVFANNCFCRLQKAVLLCERLQSRFPSLARRSRYQPLARFSSVLREAFDRAVVADHIKIYKLRASDFSRDFRRSHDTRHFNLDNARAQSSVFRRLQDGFSSCERLLVAISVARTLCVILILTRYYPTEPLSLMRSNVRCKG